MPKVKISKEGEWFAKKVFIQTSQKQNSSGAYRLKSAKRSYVPSARKNTEVVVKITGSSTNFEKLKAHLKYISRNGNLEVESSDEEIFLGKDKLKDMGESFNSFIQIPKTSEIKSLSLKEKRETLNLVFSMKDHKLAPGAKIKKAAIQVIKKKYPDNYFVIAVHNDTDNPHCHVCLKMSNNFGERINPNKKDLADLRKSFALELNNLGIEATATIKRKIGERETKPHYYEVISFGQANYKFDENGEKSYYVQYKTGSGKLVNIWSKDLQRVIKENNIHTGEFVRFAITGEEEVKVKFRKRVKRTNELGQSVYDQIVVEKTAFNKKWDASILDRAEKKLEPLVKFSKSQFKTIDGSAAHRLKSSTDVNIAPTLQQSRSGKGYSRDDRDKKERGEI